MRNRSVILLALIVLALVRSASAQSDLAKYITDHYTKREVYVTARDGVKLFTAIYEPKDKSKKYPILLNRTPYTVAPYGADKFKQSLGPGALFAKEGYIFVYQDVRGRWMSEGTFEDIRPDIENTDKMKIDESTDTYDTIDWLVKNVDNNNGKVGIYGISYPGFYTSAGSIDSHPALMACSPQAPVSDWFHGDDMHHNGALFLSPNFAFFGFFGQDRPVPTGDLGTLKQWKGRDSGDGYDVFLKLGGLKEISDYFEVGIGQRVKFWDSMMAHPNYDDFWKARNILPKLRNIGCATMTVGGWYDNENLYGALRTYQHIERQNPNIPFNVLVVGPWDHGGWSRNDGEWLGTAYFGSKTSHAFRARIEVPFFNHFLKGEGDISEIKEVNLFDTGTNRWRSFESYDPPNAEQRLLYLGAGGSLSLTKPTESALAFDEYVSDPTNPVPYTQKISQGYARDYMTEDQRFASTRPDVLVYETAPLADDLTIAGDLKPELFVSSSGTDADFIVKLIDVHPDDYRFPEGVRPPMDSAWTVFEPGGYQRLLRGEPMPARFRNSFERPEPLVANTPTKLSFVMPGVAHTFKKGHRIMIQIQSTWFPLVARNPQKFMANYKLGTAADFRKATQRIFRSAKYPSAIRVGVIK